MHKPTDEIANNLYALRAQAGVSASALAKAAGVSRQTIYAIEKGTYVPNTVVSLRLARILGATVEELFSLPEQPAKPQSRKVVLPTTEALQPGQPVQLCEVDSHLVAVPSAASWFLPASDAVISNAKPVGGRTRVNVHEPGADLGNRILLAGCDPAMSMLARYLQPAGVHAILFHQNSSQSLSLLKRSYAHVAGTHLRDESTGEPNIAAIRQHFPAESISVFSFAVWQEGLAVASGNPKNITGVEDLARRDIRFMNREPGAGSRYLLDCHLKRLGINASNVSGYGQTASGHLASAWEVKREAADCCLSTQTAAYFFGLDFIALQTSRYDLVIRKQHLHTPGIRDLLDVINRALFRSELGKSAGYDTSVTGRQIL